MSRPVILHVAQIDVTPESGMGRVAWHWRRELEARGYEWVDAAATAASGAGA